MNHQQKYVFAILRFHYDLGVIRGRTGFVLCALPLGDDVTTCFLKQNRESNNISDIRNLNDEPLDYADTSSFQDHSGANSGRADKVHCAFGQRVYGSIPPSSGLGLRLEN